MYRYGQVPQVPARLPPNLLQWAAVGAVGVLLAGMLRIPIGAGALAYVLGYWIRGLPMTQRLLTQLGPGVAYAPPGVEPQVVRGNGTEPQVVGMSSGVEPQVVRAPQTTPPGPSGMAWSPFGPTDTNNGPTGHGQEVGPGVYFNPGAGDPLNVIRVVPGGGGRSDVIDAY